MGKLLKPRSRAIQVNRKRSPAHSKLLQARSLPGSSSFPTCRSPMAKWPSLICQNTSGKINSSGDLRLENAQIRKVNVGYPIALNYEVSDDLSSDVIQIHRAQIKLGPTPVSIAGTLNSKPTPAQIDMKLTASNAS